jgi:hypothetical protein
VSILLGIGRHLGSQPGAKNKPPEAGLSISYVGF